MLTNLVSRMEDEKVGKTYQQLMEDIAKKEKEDAEKAKEAKTLVESKMDAKNELMDSLKQKVSHLVRDTGGDTLEIATGAPQSVVVKVIGYAK